MLKIGIVGLGTVGSSVVKILQKNKEIIKSRAGVEIVPAIGVARNLEKHKDLGIVLSDNVDDILEDDSIDMVVELIGGVETAYGIVKRALEKGKSVVTANKALLAYHRYELQEIANGQGFGFEASVAGGIPIIKSLREGLSANQILSIKGILNGTCNYMLTKMIEEGVSFSEVLKEAQELGYAEADPTFDVGGFDASHKLLILASIAYGINAKPEDILIEGIEAINEDDIFFAKEFGYNIKLLAIAKKEGNSVELRVHPALIKKEQMIAKVDGVMNGVSVVGDFVGETLYYGAGAGGDATASAVVSDIISIARGETTPMLGFKKLIENELSLVEINDIETEYYVRMSVIDEVGVLSKISSLFAKHKISIDSFLQKSIKSSGKSTLLFSTHKCREKRVRDALSEIGELDFVQEKPTMIRIED
ncbi:MAG: homoserine dehydrogenase [Epsilonproteobacteria bacterium]|nr:homoserine dehydrogenase [Campylobacterota bacterium]